MGFTCFRYINIENIFARHFFFFFFFFFKKNLRIDRYNEFREVNKHLVEYTDSLRYLPIRIYLPDNCPVVQELVSFYGDSGKKKKKKIANLI
jgi:hypothetical protein